MIADESISATVQKLFSQQLVDRDVDTALVAYDLDYLRLGVRELQRAFPAPTLHAIAVKANPLRAILEYFRDWGCGFEVASLPELELARALNVSARKVVFDSPAKTIEELRTAIELGCHINIDSFQELQRIDRAVHALGENRGTATFGIRINPQVGTGKIETTSVAGEYSKFGIPLSQYEDELTQAYLNRPWLTGVHLHIGSQGCPMDMLLKGCRVVLDFAERVNERLEQRGGRHRIRIFDIGGGLPVSYHREGAVDTMASYAQKLSNTAPALFEGRYTIVTEFGRHINANAGWVLSRVEYVKPSANVKTAVIHVGADIFLRKCYRPNDWHHDVTVLDKTGRLKSGELEPYNIAGPLCFSGDFVAKEILLPQMEEGDYVVIRDAGAYTLSMWSRYNSRQVPRVLGYRNDGSNIVTIRHRERVEDVLAFWGTNNPD